MPTLVVTPQNTVAERLNGFIKLEYLDRYQLENRTDAYERLYSAVRLCNEERTYMSTRYNTPSSSVFLESKEGCFLQIIVNSHFKVQTQKGDSQIHIGKLQSEVKYDWKVV